MCVSSAKTKLDTTVSVPCYMVKKILHFSRGRETSVHSSGKSSGLHRGTPIAIQTLMLI